MIAVPETRLSWHRVRAGRYITSTCSGTMTDRSGHAFLIRHLTVNRTDDGLWRASWHNGGDDHRDRNVLADYRTMRAAKVALEAAIRRMDEERRYA